MIHQCVEPTALSGGPFSMRSLYTYTRHHPVTQPEAASRHRLTMDAKRTLSFSSRSFFSSTVIAFCLFSTPLICFFFRFLQYTIVRPQCTMAAKHTARKTKQKKTTCARDVSLVLKNHQRFFLPTIPNDLQPSVPRFRKTMPRGSSQRPKYNEFLISTAPRLPRDDIFNDAEHRRKRK